jgi:hypothetical protein
VALIDAACKFMAVLEVIGFDPERAASTLVGEVGLVAVRYVRERERP